MNIFQNMLRIGKNKNKNIDDVHIDEYFIEENSGQELNEWSDLTGDEDSGSSLTFVG